MSTRVRHPTATPGPSQARSQGPSAPVNAPPPDYEHPTFPLNAAAQRALAQLSHKHDVKKLIKSIESSQSALQDSAAEVHDRLREREEKWNTAQQKRRDRGDDNEQDASHQKVERDLKKLREKAQDMTPRMEEQMRNLIDFHHSLTQMQAGLASVEAASRLHANTQSNTQQRSQRTRAAGGAGEDVDGEDLPEFTPTDPAGGTQQVRAPKDVFLEHVNNAKLRYQDKPLSERYADNEKYRDFRRAVHEAQHPEDDVVDDPRKWFNDGVAPQPGVALQGVTNNDDDSEDDIAIARTTISIKCPLTLQEFKNPITSKKCPHTFEQSAILELISQSGPRRLVQCPVGGCRQTLTRSDLHLDKIIARKIKRIQDAKRAQEEGDDEDEGNLRPDGTQRRGHIIHSDGIDTDDTDDEEDDVPAKTKTEPKATAKRPGSSPSSRTDEVDMSETLAEDDDMEDV